jgi:two-component system, NarL family, sensor histidine kinase UhpB
LQLRGARRTLASLVLAAAIPVLLFGGWAVFVTANQERAEARRTAFETVDRVAERVTSELSSQLEVLETLAASAALDQPDLQTFYREAERLKAARPLWETVELADPAGMQVLNLLRPLGARLGPTVDRDSFERVLRTRRSAIGGIGPVGPLSGKRLVYLRAPVIRDGELRYVLAAALAPDAVSSFLRSAGAPKGWIGAVVDAEGNIVARTMAEAFELGRPASQALRAAIARAPEGYYYGRTLEGIEVETVYRTLPRTGGWSVHFGVSSEVLNAPVRQSLFVLAGGGIASLALAAGLGILTARDIAQRRRDHELRSAIALKVSEERGAVAVEAADLGAWHWDVERDEIVGSERCRALLDLPRASPYEAGWRWTSKEFLAAVHADDRLRLEEALRQCLDRSGPMDVEFRTAWRDGSLHWVRATGRAPRLDPERLHLVHGVMADVDPQKRAEAERLELLRRLSEAQENEQRRIARELHDQVGQTVTGLSLGLKGLEKTLETQRARKSAREQVAWLQALTTKIGRDIHRAASDLRPTALDDLGLHKALAAYASDWSERFGVATDVQILGSGDRLPAEIETAVYRIVQEALTNVLKHAAARSVSVVLERRADQLRVIVEDDGVGFDPREAETSPENGSGRARPRLGLSGIRERLALVGGKMALESASGVGTTLFIQIPLSPGEQRAGA